MKSLHCHADYFHGIFYGCVPLNCVLYSNHGAIIEDLDVHTSIWS
jgi:hypothetical protein